MSAPRTTSRQEFLLGPEKTRPVNFHQQNRDPKLQKEKMSMFKRHLATSRLRSDEAIRRKVEMLKEQRSLSNLSKSGIQRDMEAASKARMEEELGRPVSSNEWPFVYFVVTLDQMPQNVDEMNGEHNTKASHTARERQRFLTSRRRKIQEAREETERIREAGIDMGLRLEPIKMTPAPDQNTMTKMRCRASLTKHPTTPVSSIGSRADFSILNSHDDLSDVEITRRNLGYLISDTLSQAGMPPKNGRHCPISSLELPEISASAKRRALGASNKTKSLGLGERKVTFAEGLPIIKGNGIQVSGNVASASLPTPPTDYTSSPIQRISNSRGFSGKDEKSEESCLRTPWSTPQTTRSLNSLGQRSRIFAPMALPKVDIVSEIYDELIVKTIQNYLVAEGYSSDKLQQLRQTVLARLSATYPHLVKHRAWRLTHSPIDKLCAADEEGEEVVMADPEKLQPRQRMHGRFNKVMVERGLTYDQMRPFTSPYSPVEYEQPLTQSFMAIDGRTMTFSSRDELRLRNIGTASTPHSKVPGTVEEGDRQRDYANDKNSNDNMESTEVVKSDRVTVGDNDTTISRVEKDINEDPAEQLMNKVDDNTKESDDIESNKTTIHEHQEEHSEDNKEEDQKESFVDVDST